MLITGEKEAGRSPSLPCVGYWDSVSRLRIELRELVTPAEKLVVVERQPRLLGMGVTLNAENVIQYLKRLEPELALPERRGYFWRLCCTHVARSSRDNLGMVVNQWLRYATNCNMM